MRLRGRSRAFPSAGTQGTSIYACEAASELDERGHGVDGIEKGHLPAFPFISVHGGVGNLLIRSEIRAEMTLERVGFRTIGDLPGFGGRGIAL